MTIVEKSFDPISDLVNTEAKYLRIVAGPGTGKTFALKRKIAHLLNNCEIDPENILAITFTRLAAKDLEKEINSLGIKGVLKVRKGTLHSIGLSLLHNVNYFLNFNRNPRFLLEYEERFLIEDLGLYVSPDSNMGITERKDLLQSFKSAWAREQFQTPGWPIEEREKEFNKLLVEWLTFHKAMLVGEIIPFCINYLSNNPLAEELNNYRYILVDEYQDLNKAEQHLIDLLSKNASLLIVGDEDQSIYETLKFAHPEGITSFSKSHIGTIDKPLQECRRCPINIVTIANELISHNENREKHQLLPFNENGFGKIDIIQWPNLNSEIEGVAKFINHKVKSKDYDPGQILVLCPTRHFGKLIYDKLIEKGCPAHSYFREEWVKDNPTIVDKSKSQQAFTLLKLFLDPHDCVALRTFLGFGHANLYSKEYKQVRDYCYLNGISVNDFLLSEQSLSNDLKISNLIEKSKQLNEKLLTLQSLELSDQLDYLFPPNEEWSESFRNILEANKPITDLKSLLDIIESNIIEPEMPIDVDYVRIMTLHKSKGLTADHVIIISCVQNVIPTKRDKKKPLIEQVRAEEEQRRLFYVSITRAKKTLLLSSYTSMPSGLAHKMKAHNSSKKSNYTKMITSQFITELGVNTPKVKSGDDWLTNELN